MTTFTRFSLLLPLCTLIAGLLLPTETAQATPERVSLLYGEWKPQELISVSDSQVVLFGQIWRGTIDTLLVDNTPAPTPIAALLQADSRLTVTCTRPASTVGIQFLGDSNDGWAKIQIDGLTESWHVKTRGGNLVNDSYFEITNLPYRPHVIHVETGAAPDSNEIGHVTIVAFGCGTLISTSAPNFAAGPATTGTLNQPQQTIFLPLVMS